MMSSFVISLAFLFLNKSGHPISADKALLLTVAVTTICWVATAFLGPETERATLIEFYRKVRPAGPGWRSIRKQAGSLGASGTREKLPLALVGWLSGCTAIWSALFTVGNFLYGRIGYAWLLLGVFIISGLILVYVINEVWSEEEEPPRAQENDQAAEPLAEQA